MISGTTWLPVLAALAGPIVVALVYALRAKRDAPAITRALVQTQQRTPKYITLRPLRWYHLITTAGLLALPFVQWFAYLKYGTRLSFLLPLIIVAGLMLVVGALRPRFALVEPRNTREWGLQAAFLAAALTITLILPASGTIINFRGALSDILVLSIVSFLISVSNTPKTKVGT